MHPQKMKFLDSYHAGERTKVLKWDLGRAEAAFPCTHRSVWPLFKGLALQMLPKVQWMTLASCYRFKDQESVWRSCSCSPVVRPSCLPEPMPQAYSTPSSNTHPCAKVPRSPWSKRKPSPGITSFSFLVLVP